MIVPAILTNNIEEFKRMLKLSSTFCDYAQIDIMDGKFVPSYSISLKDLKDITERVIAIEGHLMVEDPLPWIGAFKNLGARRVIFHFEIKKDHLEVIRTIKQEGLEAGLAVNSGTSLDEFKFLLPHLDSILFMSVEPGFYGSKFIPEVLDKIKQFRLTYPDVYIGIDGGVSENNIVKVKESGVNYICVGSAIFKSNSPYHAYLKLSSLINDKKK